VRACPSRTTLESAVRGVPLGARRDQVIAGAALIPAPLRLKPTETHTADEATSEGSWSVTVRDACASAPGHDEFVGSALSSPRQIAESQNEEAPKR
jgi:hypothetical protein